MDWSVKPPVGFTVADELHVFLFVADLQLFDDVRIAFTGEEKCPPGVLAEIGVIVECGDFIIDGHAADIRTDIMGSVVDTA